MTVATQMELRIRGFGHDQQIPGKHTGEGEDVSPAIEWSGVPEGTKELVLICDDPDAPRPYGWTHWIVCGIPPTVTSIPDGGGAEYVQGRTDFGKEGYGGPMPPPGHGTHHYYFWLYALSAASGAQTGISRLDLLATIKDSVISQARVVGVYSR